MTYLKPLSFRTLPHCPFPLSSRHTDFSNASLIGTVMDHTHSSILRWRNGGHTLPRTQVMRRHTVVESESQLLLVCSAGWALIGICSSSINQAHHSLSSPHARQDVQSIPEASSDRILHHWLHTWPSGVCGGGGTVKSCVPVCQFHPWPL